MSTVRITLTGSNEHVWTGPLREFLRSNAFDRQDRRQICAGLRRNPVRFGGGAAPVFTVALLTALLAGCSNLSPLVIAMHASDPTDGGVSDTTVDFLGAGVTATFGGVSIDAALGRKAINCDAIGRCPSTPGGMATLRWNPRAPR